MEGRNVNEFGAIVLAAGLSERMGSLKPLLQLGDKTLFECVLTNPFLRRSNVRPVVVLGHEADSIRERIPPSIPWIVNADYQKGRTTSIQYGLRFLSNSVQGVYIWPVDCPVVSNSVLEMLQDRFENSSDICIPSHKRKRGHPPLIGRAYFSEILKMKCDGSLRDLYAFHTQNIHHVDVDDVSVLDNINTPSDFRALCERLERNRR